MKTFNVITIFPDMIDSAFKEGVVARARENGVIAINPINLRDFTFDKHHTTDDYQYGGGVGLVMKAEPLCDAVKSVREREKTIVILTDPRGKRFGQKDAERLASLDCSITFICGRYEGIDERVRSLAVDEEYSIGDFVLSGGEIAVCAIIDAVSRLIPQVLGDENSAVDESFTTGMLEYPHYTRPAEYEGLKVPDVLVNGNHADIEKWHRDMALSITLEHRPDLLDISELDKKTRLSLCSAYKRGKSRKLQLNVALMHWPMRDKEGSTVAAAITNMDLHDISRSCRTFGVDRYFVITPIKAQREIAERIIAHWMTGYGAEYNPNRKDAFSHTVIKGALTEAIEDIENRYRKRPILIATTAHPGKATITSKSVGVIAEDTPVLILFGTGWGFRDEVFDLADYVLEPIEGSEDFNHLSVRSAVAIFLDRITEKTRRIQ